MSKMVLDHERYGGTRHSTRLFISAERLLTVFRCMDVTSSTLAKVAKCRFNG